MRAAPVDVHPTLAEFGTGDLPAALVVAHLAGELADAAPRLAPLAPSTRVIAVLPRTTPAR